MKRTTITFVFLIMVSVCVFAQVGINTSAPNANTLLHVSETKDGTVSSKGIIIPRLTTTQRNSMTNTSSDNGLIIYNTDENCFNYYQTSNSTWLSLCGTMPKAAFTVADCSKIRVYGNYTAGTSLNTSNYISIPVTVTTAGTYSILAQTSNGYYFEKSGIFPSAGTYTINLTGSGIPSTGATTDAVSFSFNGTANTSCTSVSVTVKSSQVSYVISCGGTTVNGNYLAGIILDYNDNNISIPLSNIDTGGAISFVTSTNNGVNFIANQNITTSSTSITLHGSGTPTLAGTYAFTFTTNGANPQTCLFPLHLLQPKVLLQILLPAV